MIDHAFAQLLRQTREEKKLSQEAFASIVGLHRTYVSQLERGVKSPSLRTLYKISQGLNIKLSALFSRLDESMSHVVSDRE